MCFRVGCRLPSALDAPNPLMLLAGAQRAPGFLIVIDFPGRSGRVADLRSTLSGCILLILFLMRGHCAGG
jgi:hypothetical protein